MNRLRLTCEIREIRGRILRLKSVGKFPAKVFAICAFFRGYNLRSVMRFLTREWPQESAKIAKGNTVLDHEGPGGGFACNPS